MTTTVRRDSHGTLCIGCGRTTFRYVRIFERVEVAICDLCEGRAWEREPALVSAIEGVLRA